MWVFLNYSTVKSIKAKIKVIAHESEILFVFFSVFLYSSSFQIKMHAMDENAENRNWSEFFMTDKSFGGSV